MNNFPQEFTFAMARRIAQEDALGTKHVSVEQARLEMQAAAMEGPFVAPTEQKEAPKE